MEITNETHLSVSFSGIQDYFAGAMHAGIETAETIIDP